MSLNQAHIKSVTFMLDDSAPHCAFPVLTHGAVQEVRAYTHRWVASEFPVLRATLADMSQLQ